LPEIIYPDWFKISFLELSDDIDEAVAGGKQGIIVYFGQKHCAYCLALIDKNFGQKDIEDSIRKNFDVIAINIWGSKEVTTPDGKIMTEREYAIREKANFTPSLIYYDGQGNKIFMLRGYYPPYKFRAAIEYVEKAYYKEESFRQYLLRADPPPKFELSDLNDQDFFMSPPYTFDRSRFKAQVPLLIFFEQQNCHACDVLHSEPLHYQDTQELLTHFDIAQLDMNANTPIITPKGEHISARQWADKLDIFYAPTLIAFDESGNEIIRIDSVAHVYRLKNVLEFIVKKNYKILPNFINWQFNTLFGGKKLPPTMIEQQGSTSNELPVGTHN
jgi:thioredoxin-related protein